MTTQAIIQKLRLEGNSKNVKGMIRFGINAENALGVSIPFLRSLAKEIGKDHQLALELWSSGIHEARILASLIDNPKLVTTTQMNVWVADFDSWDVCDQVCGNLFDKTPFAYDKAFEWAEQETEFTKRAGFVMMAFLAVHDKKASNADFEQFFSLIKAKAVDERNFVRKAVNWALRQIGKRNLALGKKAIEVAEEISLFHSKSAKWIAKDALRELKLKYSSALA